jgi:hypothetical protein
LVTTTRPSPSAGGVILLVVGVVLVLMSIGLIAGGVVLHDGVQSFNQACAQNSLCRPEPDPSGAMIAGGGVLLLVGIGLAVFGYTRLH